MISFVNLDIELNRKPVFSNLNLTIQPGELVFVAGKSGSGKSTLLKTMYMEIKPIKGELIIAGYNSRTIRKREIPLLRRKKSEYEIADTHDINTRKTHQPTNPHKPYLATKNTKKRKKK